MPRKPQRTPFSTHTGYTCSDCAVQNGGKWPEGHEATHHSGECSFCHEENFLCHVTDWDFPSRGTVRRSDDIQREI